MQSTAIVIDKLPFSFTGDTTGYFNNFSPNDSGPDVFFTFTSPIEVNHVIRRVIQPGT